MPRRRPRARLVLLSAAAGLALVLAGCSTSTTTTADTAAAASPAPPTPSASSLQDSYIAAVAKIRSSVVEISTNSGLGSGIVYDKAGDIVTNDHVVQGATSFSVTNADSRAFNATLVGAFPPDDLAVIRVTGGSGMTPAVFGDSSKLQVGEIALAVGNPLGLQSSVTNGIVSATGRTVSEGNGVTLPQTIQTSAPINPGNSGGALVDLNASVIGIPTLAATDQQLGGGAAPGIGFAIPSNTVKLIASQLIGQGRVTNSGRAAIGVRSTTGYDQTGQPAGVIIVAVTPGGPADKAGLQAGEIITSVNGKRTPTASALADTLATLSPGQQAHLGIIDLNGNQTTVTVTLGELGST